MTILNRRIPIFSYAHEVSKVIMMEEHVIIEEMHNKNPLTVFSVYTDIQSRIVRGLGQEILASLEVGITPEDGTGKGVVCSGEVIDRCYGQFWLWILGAYEVVRTMSQAEQCFSPRVVIELKGLKKRLAILRMPFAKQELRGKPIPVRTEPSIYGIGASPPDLRFEVEGQIISIREFVVEYTRVFDSITRSDILADHRANSAA